MLFLLNKIFNRCVIEPNGNRNPLFENCPSEIGILCLKIASASKFAIARKTVTSRRFLKFGLSISGHEKRLSKAKRGCYIQCKIIQVRCFLSDLHARLIIITAAERSLKLSLNPAGNSATKYLSCINRGLDGIF